MKKWIAACLAGMIVAGTCIISMAAVPWSKVNDTFVGTDGKPIEGALEKGITISKYQNRAGAINWKKIRAQDISFAMIRLGYQDDVDPYFGRNMTSAAAYGLKTGVVFFTKALSVKEAKAEAEYVLEVVKDYPMSYPIAYDVESQYLLDKKRSKKQITDQINAFCKIISEAGYRPVVYGSYEWLTKNMDTEKIPHDIWYSRYGVANKYPNRTLWQCTDSAEVDGVEGLVCLEFSFADYTELFPGTGWRRINNIWYYYIDYRMMRACTLTIDGGEYNFGPNGACINRVIKAMPK